MEENKPIFFLTNRQRMLKGKIFNTISYHIEAKEDGSKTKDPPWRQIPSRFEDSSDTPDNGECCTDALERDIVIGEYDANFKLMLYFASQNRLLNSILGEENYRNHIKAIKELEIRRIKQLFEETNRARNEEQGRIRFSVKTLDSSIILEVSKRNDRNNGWIHTENTYVLRPDDFITTYQELTSKGNAGMNHLGGEIGVTSCYQKKEEGTLTDRCFNHKVYSCIGRIQGELALQETLEVRNLQFTQCGNECFSREVDEYDASLKPEAVKALEKMLFQK